MGGLKCTTGSVKQKYWSHVFRCFVSTINKIYFEIFFFDLCWFLFFYYCFTANWWLPRSSLRMMPSISAWQRMNKVLCCPWHALLSSCLRTDPVHQEIYMLKPSQALPSCWPGRGLCTMQIKSLPTPSITWRQKVRPRGATSLLCFRFCIWAKKSVEKVWKMQDDSQQ